MTRERALPRGHVARDYGTEQIVVHWNSALCIHSANCLNGLPGVFDVRRRPWVRIDRADADSVAATVDTCPSRALTYSRLDGVEPGPNGVPVEIAGRSADHTPEPVGAGSSGDAPEPVGVAEQETAGDTGTSTPVVIALKPDGPLVVEGPVRIELARCEVVEVTDSAVLCRCGSSGNKPFCDGTHRKIGFTAEGW